MLLELELAVRFLKRRSGPLLRGTALAAFASVALATAALVITLALMSGYSGAIAAALQRGNAHMVGFSPRPMNGPEAHDIETSLATLEGVERTAAVTYLTGLVDDPSEPTKPVPVVVKAVASPPSFAGISQWPEGDVMPAVVGAGLLRQLAAEPGDTLVVRLPPESGSWILPAMTVKVVDSFRLDFPEFDTGWLVVPLDSVLAAMPEMGVAGVEIELEDPMMVDRLAPQVEYQAPALLVTNWRDMNRDLFAALRWNTLSLFVVLSLVVAVASFQISSALVVLAIDKQRATGMLLALGATPIRVWRVLVAAGLMLGGAGVLAGIVLGTAASGLATWLRIVRFPEGLAKVYMVDYIPLVVRPTDAAAVAAVCLVLVLGASIWPAVRAARLDPTVALKSV